MSDEGQADRDYWNDKYAEPVENNLDRDKVKAALEAVIADADYDLYKGIDRPEDGSEPEWDYYVEEFINNYG